MTTNIFYSILRGDWFIDPNYANAQIPLLDALRNGTFKYQGNAYPAVYSLNSSTKAGNNSAKKSKQHTSRVIPITGVITRDGTLCTPGAVGIASFIKDANNDPAVDGIILSINTPGGDARGAFIIADAISEVNKPIIAHIAHGMAASAGYWIASQCDEIYTTHVHDEIGSIGALCQLADPTGEYKARNWKIKTIYAPQSMDKNADVRASLENDDDSKIEARLFDLVESFITAVKTGRGDRLKGDDWQTGKMYNTAQAKKLGLIDGSMKLEQVPNRISKILNNITMSKKNLVLLTGLLGFAQGFESTDEGVHLQEEHLETIEQELAAKAQLSTDLSTNKQTIDNLNSQISQLNTDKSALQASITEKDNEILSLKNEITVLKGKPAPDVNNPIAGDPPSGGVATNRTIDSTTLEAIRIYKQFNGSKA